MLQLLFSSVSYVLELWRPTCLQHCHPHLMDIWCSPSHSWEGHSVWLSARDSLIWLQHPKCPLSREGHLHKLLCPAYLWNLSLGWCESSSENVYFSVEEAPAAVWHLTFRQVQVDEVKPFFYLGLGKKKSFALGLYVHWWNWEHEETLRGACLILKQCLLLVLKVVILGISGQAWIAGQLLPLFATLGDPIFLGSATGAGSCFLWGCNAKSHALGLPFCAELHLLFQAGQLPQMNHFLHISFACSYLELVDLCAY